MRESYPRIWALGIVWAQWVLSEYALENMNGPSQALHCLSEDLKLDDLQKSALFMTS